MNKTNTISRIYAKNNSPGTLGTNFMEKLSLKNRIINKSIVSIDLENNLNFTRPTAKSDTYIIKRTLCNKQGLNASARKKHSLIDKPYSLFIEEPSSSTMATNGTPTTCKVFHGDKKKGKSHLFLSSNQLENISHNISFHSQDSGALNFKLKLAHIFTTFKDNHQKIVKKFQHLNK